MAKYGYDTLGTCHWVFPDGTGVSKDGMYEHDGLLMGVPGFEYCDSEANHGQAFDLGFLRITVVSGAGELNLQWASILSASQRRRAAELVEGCSRVEMAGAGEGYDPEGNFDNLSLDAGDSAFRRRFAAGLRRKHSEWVERDC